MEDLIDIADESQPPGANRDPRQQIPQHRTDTNACSKRHRDDGRK